MNVLQAIIDAEPGDQIVYWTGYLAESCEVGQKYQTNIARAARADAQEASARKFCFLVQRRQFDRTKGFDYIAVRATK